MSLTINDTDSLKCGVFLLNKGSASYQPFGNETSIFLTQERNNRLKGELLSLISSSTKVLKLCSFILTDEDVFQAILKKAQHTDVAIFLLTQLDNKKLTNHFSLLSSLAEEEINESTALTHLRYIKILYDNGVHVRASVSAHAKFIVSDRNNGFITSANFTTPSLSQNTESGVYLDETSSTALDRLFDVVFQKGTSYRQFITTSKRSKMLVVQNEITIQPALLPSPSASEIRFTYEDLSNSLYEELITIANGAKSILYLSTYSIVSLDRLPELVSAIRKAVERGVRVRMFCRGMNYRHDHLQGCLDLCKCGVEIYADILNHSKGIVSESAGLIFTANIDGDHGLKNGFEVGYRLNETQRKDFLALHEYLIETSHYKFIVNPSRTEFFSAYADYENRKKMSLPSLPINLVLKIDETANENHPLAMYPIFYGRNGSTEFIISGNNYYNCVRIQDGFHLTGLAKPRFDLERYNIKYSTLKIGFNNG